MGKRESTFRNMVLSLSFIALGASAALGVVHKLTEGPIEESKLNKKLQAIKQVVPEFTNNPNDEMFLLATPEGDSMEVYPAKKDSVVIGYALKTWTEKGFSGRISLMTGFRPDGSIYNITVLEHKETPGLGTKMTEPGFKDQFNGKNPGEEPLKVKKDGGKVDAITAATISSRAFCDAVTRAHSTLMNKQDK